MIPPGFEIFFHRATLSQSDSRDFQLVHFAKYFNVEVDDVDKVRTSEDGTRRLVLLFLLAVGLSCAQ